MNSVGAGKDSLETNTRALNKAINASEPPTVILNVLETLKKGGNPTEEQLRSTKVGFLVGKLRNNDNKEVARAASELVIRWKRAVDAEKGRKKAASSSKSASGSSTASPTPAISGRGGATASPTPISVRTKGEPFTGDPEKRKHDTDGVNINRTGSKVRNNIIGMLYDGLAYRSRASKTDVLEKAMACEAAALDHFGSESKDYKFKMRSLFLNLKSKNNKELGERVMSGAVTPRQFVTFTTEELKPAELKKVEEKLMEENVKNAQVAEETRSISAELVCGRCNQRKVAYTQAQTRSADEPMTTFCECMECGNRWKFS